MQFTADFFSMAQLPVDAFSGPAQLLGHSARYPRHVKDGMALEYLRQAIRQIADKAFAGSLAQFKSQVGFLGAYLAADKANVVSAFFSAAKQRFEKIIRPRSRKYFIQKNLIQILRSHAFPHQVTGFAVVEKETADQTPAVKALA